MRGMNARIGTFLLGALPGSASGNWGQSRYAKRRTSSTMARSVAPGQAEAAQNAYPSTLLEALGDTNGIMAGAKGIQYQTRAYASRSPGKPRPGSPPPRTAVNPAPKVPLTASQSIAKQLFPSGEHAAATPGKGSKRLTRSASAAVEGGAVDGGEKKKKGPNKPKPATLTRDYELSLAGKAGAQYVIGVDEVGQGALAGPLVVVAMYAPMASTADDLTGAAYVQDSKDTTKTQRLAVKSRLARPSSTALFATAFGTPAEIDAAGVYTCREGLWRKAVAELMEKIRASDAAQGGQSPSPSTTSADTDAFPQSVLVLVDGDVKLPQEDGTTGVKGPKWQAEAKGDGTCYSIACAANLAKLERDALMTGQVHRDHPEYGFDRHKGYPTADHDKAIEKHGLCSAHRRTFTRKYLKKSMPDSN